MTPPTAPTAPLSPTATAPAQPGPGGAAARAAVSVPGDRRWPGVAVAVAVAAVATPIGLALPVLGAPVAAIVLGVLLSGRLGRRQALRPGLAFSASTVLQLAVVVLGTQMSLGEVASVGLSSLPVMLGTLAICLTTAALLARWLRVESDLAVLVGVGTAVCGASAIAAVSPVVRARGHAVAYALSTIFLFNVVAVLLLPPVGHLLGLSQDQFALLAGTAVNDTSSVVAAGSTYGHEAGTQAVVVKLVRTLSIIPIVLVLGAVVRRRDRRGGAGVGADGVGAAGRVPRVPWFFVGFLVLAGVSSVVSIPDDARTALAHLSVFLITVALAAIGLSTDVAGLRRAGWRPLAMGFVLWLVVTVSSLGLVLLVS
ncbi:putative sulfate exporter family transporter [Nocardioides sp. GY 10127]|uniref:YeiH family protein n=1 Tax=Nocardioides sp. GY 10127 TaxID=2569762 RepID=UPI001F0F8F32|nr:putative sulfate exporter family transporter [Nocardioides sp. GY 10127]